MKDESRNGKIKAVVDSYRQVDPELRDLIADSDDDLAASVAATLPLEEITEPVEARPLTKAEVAEVEHENLLTEIYGTSSIPEVPLGMTAADVAKFRRSRPPTLAELIDASVQKVFASAQRGDSNPLSVLDTAPTGINKSARRLAELAEEFVADSPTTAFVKAFAAGDRDGMRRVIRGIARSAD